MNFKGQLDTFKNENDKNMWERRCLNGQNDVLRTNNFPCNPSARISQPYVSKITLILIFVSNNLKKTTEFTQHRSKFIFSLA